MPILYRVLPFLPGAAPGQPGHPLYIPPQGGGRLDNPDIYRILYLADQASGAIAESFGRFPEWTSAILAGSPSLPGSSRVLARYNLPDTLQVCNLDDPQQLITLHLRPSEIVSRAYADTRAWARRIFAAKLWGGIRWWSYYDPRWSSFGLWDIETLRFEEIIPLTLDTPALIEAATVIARPIRKR